MKQKWRKCKLHKTPQLYFWNTDYKENTYFSCANLQSEFHFLKCIPTLTLTQQLNTVVTVQKLSSSDLSIFQYPCIHYESFEILIKKTPIFVCANLHIDNISYKTYPTTQHTDKESTQFLCADLRVEVIS